ncbi:hypothetical protein ACO0LO_05920 [Undibacterium sp. TJN25]|uniref:hypothetical protein n=1 Tax=Undibacterium sp. TJN25 TaxID=3413056 RepID=UPI003BF14873
MKKFAFALILNALSIAAIAQTAPDTETVTIAGIEKPISLPSNYHKMWPNEYREYQGAYMLSNGKTFSVFSKGTKMYAKMEDQERHEIVAIAPNAFVSLDEKLKMRVDLHDDGNVSGELLMLVPRANIAGSGVSSEELVTIAFR